MKIHCARPVAPAVTAAPLALSPEPDARTGRLRRPADLLPVMLRLSCFGPPRDAEDWDALSQGSGGTEAAGENDAATVTVKKKHALFPNKHVLNRDALKVRLKKILLVKKEHTEKSDKGRRAPDPEFILLGKIYSELEDVSNDLRALARNGQALSHMLPFILNAMLYGNREREPMTSGRSNRKSGSMKMQKSSPREMSLNGASHLQKSQFAAKLERFLYEQAVHSVHFAVECSWYFMASLFLGPQDCYHRTMTMMLGMESVVINAAEPGDLFRNAGMTNNSGVRKEIRPAVPSDATIPSTALNAVPEDGVLELSSASVSAVDADSVPGEVEDISAPEPHRPNSIREVKLNTKDDLKIHFGPMKMAEEARLSQWLEARRERANTFHAELDFIKCLTDISNGLFSIDLDLRRDVLRRELEKLNGFIPQNVFIPTYRRPHRVLRIVPEEAHVFSTKERVPYLLVVEVEDLMPPGKDDDHSKFGPLRRIGSMSAGPSSSPSAGRNAPETPNPNRPDEKFQFSPDVTLGNGDLRKRESSFRVESQDPEDRRPPDEELLKAMGERWSVKEDRIRKASPFGSHANWRLISCIVKARDQLRQEMLAQRLIQEFAYIFDRAKLPLWLRPYEILSTSSDSGLIETVVDAKSIDSIKKNSPNIVTLQDYFVGRFGGKGSQGYRRAVKNFVNSMAAYSVVQYLLNIKDRHNGNLMIDAEGHIVHIDFGFFLSNSPGGNMEFEKAPFKLTSEMVGVMGGIKSGLWKHFRKLCIQGYVEACRNADKFMLMVDVAYPGNEAMPCFLQGRDYVLENLRERFGVDLSKRERMQRMSRLIGTANGNWSTRAYDQFQRLSLGIAK